MRSLIAMLFLATHVLAQPLSGTYTIGGVAPSYASFTAAISALTANGVSGPVVFNVRAGTYTEQLSIPAITGASSANTITFQSETGVNTSVVLQFDPTMTNNWVWQLNGVDYLTIQNMTLRVATLANTYGRVIVFSGDVTHSIIHNNILQSTTPNFSSREVIHKFVIADQCEYNTISNNTITGGSAGIWWNGNTTATVVENSIINNVVTDWYYIGMKLSGFEDCQVEGNTIASSIDYTKFGIEISTCAGGNTFTRNTINLSAPDDQLAGIYFNGTVGSAAKPNLVSNNFISVRGSTNTLCRGISFINSRYSNFYNNSVFLDCSSALTAHGPFVAVGTTVATNNFSLLNNIFYNNTGNYCINFYENYPGVTSNYNTLVHAGTQIAYRSGVNYTTLANWQALGYDANSNQLNPGYVSATDLHITNSALYCQGTPLASVTVDIDGQGRNNPPTIGADEPLCATCGGPMAGSYTVGSGGNFPTISCAVSNLVARGVSAPVTFNILTGIYTEQVNLTSFSNPGNHLVTFQSQAQDSTQVTVQFDGTASNFAVWQFNGCANVLLRWLTLQVTGISIYKRVVQLVNTTNNIRIENNRLIGLPTISVATNNVVVYELLGPANVANGLVIRNNVVMNGSDGISVSGESAVQAGNVIEGNRISNFARWGIYNREETGTSIRNNIVRSLQSSPGQIGIYVFRALGTLANPVIVANNMVTQETMTNNFNGINVFEGNNVNVYYNSVRANGATTTYALRLQNVAGSNIRIVNNILALAAGDASLRIDNTAKVATCNYNNLFSAGNEGNINGTNYASLGAWQTATGFDANSLAADPLFVSGTDLHIQAASPVIDQATPLSLVTTDLDGETRSPDMGADEFPDPLPVELVGLKAIPQTNQWVLVQWTLDGHDPNIQYDLQRSFDGQDFTSITPLASTQTALTLGSHADYGAQVGPNYYRLRSLDAEGREQWSRTVEARLTAPMELNLWPNPASQSLHLEVYGLESTHAKVCLLNLAGQEVMQLQPAVQNGQLQVHLEVQHLPRGVYQMRVESTGRPLLKRVVLQ